MLFDRGCCKAVIAVIAVIVRCRESLARAPVSRKALNTIKDGLLALCWVVVAALAVLRPSRALLAIATCWTDCLPWGVRSGCAVVGAIVTCVAHASWRIGTGLRAVEAIIAGSAFRFLCQACDVAVCSFRTGLWEVISSFSICRVALEAVVAGRTGDRMHSGGQAVRTSRAWVALVNNTC